MKPREFLKFFSGVQELSKISAGTKPHTQEGPRTPRRTNTKNQSNKTHHAETDPIAKKQMQYIVFIRKTSRHFCP